MIQPSVDVNAGVAPSNPLHAERPVWSLIGPVLGALQGAFLLTATIGEWSALRRSLGLSSLAMLGLFAAYLLAAAVTAPIGILVGRRWPTAVAVPGMVLMILGLVTTALAPAGAVLLLGHAVTGLGVGAVWGVVAALVWQGGAWRTRAVATLAGAAVLALILGPAVAALLEPATGWRWMFLLAVPAAMVVLLVTVASGIALLVRRASTPLPG
jgi:MFS family permease